MQLFHIQASRTLILASAALICACTGSSDRGIPAPSDRIEEHTAPTATGTQRTERAADPAVAFGYPMQANDFHKGVATFQTAGWRIVTELPGESLATAGEPIGPLVARIVDSAGNTVKGAHGVDIRVDLVDGEGALHGVTSRNSTYGVAVFSDLDYRVAEEIRLNVRTNPPDIALPQNLTLRIVAANAATLVVNANTDQQAGEAFGLNVVAKDAFGNRATGYRGTVAFHTLSPMASMPMPYTFTALDEGQHVFDGGFTLRSAGSWALQATDFESKTLSTAGVAFSVSPGMPVALELSGVPGSVVAGSPLELTVAARDAFGNAVQGAVSMVTPSSTDPQATISGPIALIDEPFGTGGLVLRTAGTWAVTVQDPEDKLPPATAMVMVTPAKAASLVFAKHPNSAVVGSILHPKPTVVVRDAFGNLAPTTSTLTLELAGSSGALVGVATGKAVGGVASFDGLVVQEAGDSYTLKATCDDLVATGGKAFPVFATLNASLSQLSLDQPMSQAIDINGRGTQSRMRLTGMSGQIGKPAGLCNAADGTIYIAQEPDGAERPVLRLEVDGTLSSSDGFEGPGAIAIGAGGNVYAGTHGAIRGPLASFDGGNDAVWAELADLIPHDMAWDRKANRVYIADSALQAGRVIEVDAITQKTRILLAPGDETSLAVHPEARNLWVVTRNAGDLYVVNTGTGDGTVVTWLTTLDLVRTEHLEFHTLGTQLALYVTAQWETAGTPDAGIVRLDPETLDLAYWVTGLADAPPMDMTCGEADPEQPMYVTLQGVGVMELSCPEHVGEVSKAITLHALGYHVAQEAQLPSGPAVGPTGIAVHDKSGTLLLGAGATSSAAQPITVLTATGEVVKTAPITDPDAVGVDSQGWVYAAGSGSIWRSHISELDADWTLWMQTGGDIDDLKIGGDDVVVVALADGQVIRAAQNKDASVILGAGEPAAIAIDAQGTVWAIRSGGAVWRIIQGQDAEQVAELAAEWPGLTAVQSADWSPHDGRIYLAASSDAGGEHASILRWHMDEGLEEFATVQDPAHPEFVAGADANAAGGLAWSTSEPCLYFSAHESGKVHRICECQ